MKETEAAEKSIGDLIEALYVEYSKYGTELKTEPASWANYASITYGLDLDLAKAIITLGTLTSTVLMEAIAKDNMASVTFAVRVYVTTCRSLGQFANIGTGRMDKIASELLSLNALSVAKSTGWILAHWIRRTSEQKDG
jgi:hypothetical protein